VTVLNLQVMQVREAEKIILISGAVPGANGSYVVVRPAVKNPEAQTRKTQGAKKPAAAATKSEAPAEKAAPKQEAAKK
jgi:large subunit ribosomal protein L3